MKTSERLLEMLRKLDLDIPEGARLERAPGAYSGYKRTEGAWVWNLVDSNGIPVQRDSAGRPMAVGSQWTMTELVRLGVEVNRDWSGDISIDPPTEVQQQKAAERRAATGEQTLPERLFAALRGEGVEIAHGASVAPGNHAWAWHLVDPSGLPLGVQSRLSMGELLRLGITVHHEHGFVRVDARKPSI